MLNQVEITGKIIRNTERGSLVRHDLGESWVPKAAMKQMRFAPTGGTVVFSVSRFIAEQNGFVVQKAAVQEVQASPVVLCNKMKMKLAWELAREGAKKFGGSPKEYIAKAMSDVFRK